MSERLTTPGQTIGPFFHFALPFAGDRELVPLGSQGSVRLHGYVRDGQGAPIPDALIEIRQAGSDGRVPVQQGSLRRSGATFTGWGRSHTDNSGHYWFSTLQPGPAAAGQVPFFAVTIFARGLLDNLFTRAYLPQDQTPLSDKFLSSVPAVRREKLFSVREADGSLRFDITLQGDDESVFLTYPRRGY